MQYLLLGGSHDGEWIDIDEGIQSIRMLKKKRFTPSFKVDSLKWVSLSAEQEVYYDCPLRLREVNRETTSFPIMTCPLMTATQILHTLISGYKKGEQRG